MSTLANYIRQKDDLLLYLVNQKLHCRILDRSMSCITHLGSLTFAIAVPIYLYLMQHVEAAMRTALCLLLSQLLAQLLKRLVHRVRPYVRLQTIKALHPPACRYSFPSGHTCAAFAHGFTLSTLFPAAAPLFLGGAVLVALSRIYLGVHYPTDVLVGIILAYASFLTIGGLLL